MSLFSSLRLRIPLAVLRGAACRVAAGEITQVVAGRNDGYGDRSTERLRACIGWNRRWLRCLTVFVEWNPPEGKELLSLALVSEFPDVVCYVVPAALHHTIPQTSGRPFLEYYAKNVGIRRASTPWIAACNTDIVVLPDCRRHLGGLGAADLPRTRRVDFPFGGARPSLWEVLDGRRYLRFRCIEGIGASAPGDFTMAHRDLWWAAGGYEEHHPDRRVLCDVQGVAQLVAHGGAVRWVGTHLHFDHPESTSGGRSSAHGEDFDPLAEIPYANTERWGFAGAREERLAERVWKLVL